jgi:hypothetical protein
VLYALLEDFGPDYRQHADTLFGNLNSRKSPSYQISLPALQDDLKARLLNGSLGNSFVSVKESEFAEHEREPPKPPPFREPEKTKEESQQQYEERKNVAFRQHKELERKHDEWERARSEFIKTALGSPAELKRFGTTQKKEGLDAEFAAIHVLTEIDGLIVAKVFQSELEEFLKRVPLTALLKGTVKMNWEVPDIGKVTVPIARITPSPLLPEINDDAE